MIWFRVSCIDPATLDHLQREALEFISTLPRDQLGKVVGTHAELDSNGYANDQAVIARKRWGFELSIAAMSTAVAATTTAVAEPLNVENP